MSGRRPSLARRLFRAIVLIGLANVVLTLVAIEFIYEDMENAIQRLELAEARKLVQQRVGEAGVKTWNSALHTATFVPEGVDAGDLPALFAGRTPPFADEVKLEARTYLVSVERIDDPRGVLYLADDITVLEDREDELQMTIALLAFGMLLVGSVLAWGGTRRVLAPLDRLTRQIAGISPASGFARLADDQGDEEVARIAATLNDLLAALDEHVRREQSLISMASHELRTPVAVIAGALDVLEQRATLSDADRRTIARIRRATDAMQADIEALLRLARRSDGQATGPVSLGTVIASVIAEVEAGSPADRGRVTMHDESVASPVEGDAALLRMLVRNLVQNALRHTRGKVRIELLADSLTVADDGPGLPEEVGRRMSEIGRREIPADGLGLFIVKLICERLGWSLAAATGPAGTAVSLRFNQSAGAQAAKIVRPPVRAESSQARASGG